MGFKFKFSILSGSIRHEKRNKAIYQGIEKSTYVPVDYLKDHKDLIENLFGQVRGNDVICKDFDSFNKYIEFAAMWRAAWKWVAIQKQLDEFFCPEVDLSPEELTWFRVAETYIYTRLSKELDK